jgi:trk system potassium uptake protein TrkA
MRAVFIGAGVLAITTARYLLKRGHEVVVIERDRELIQELSLELDCGFIHGDGSKPAILREADPEHTDTLFCLTNSDQANIIASLVGRSLGFKQVVTKIDDPEFEHICLELGLENTIIPARTVGRHLADMCEGRDPLELSTMIRDEARAYSFVVRDEQAGPLSDFALPPQTRVICIYRDDRLIFPDDDTQLRSEDEMVLLAHRDRLDELKRQLAPPTSTAG